MHPSARFHGKCFFDTYLTRPGLEVVEIGSRNVNGSLRDFCPSHAKSYVGVDFAAGNGVDVVLTDPYRLPLADASADAVICSSCLEHSELFWLTFLEMLRILRPSGLCYINVPSNGQYHRFPVDCWRFYPDSGHALVTWARRNKLSTVLLESFIGQQATMLGTGGTNEWNDFVAVFLKDEQHLGQHLSRITDKFWKYESGYRHGNSAVLKRQTKPEDQRKLAAYKTTTTEGKP
jgi:SAM-dependent methyltransferase